MAILVDTSAWFARFVADDPEHARVATWFAENDKPLITTDYCVDEVLTLLIARKRPLLAVEAGRLLFDESVAQLPVLTSEQFIALGLCFNSGQLPAGVLLIARARL